MSCIGFICFIMSLQIVLLLVLLLLVLHLDELLDGRTFSVLYDCKDVQLP